MKWFADNSELNGIREAEIPDILLFGGVAVPPECERKLAQVIEAVKGKYGHPRAPVKWNFKDLQSLYQKQKAEKLYEAMRDRSKEWRTEIFDQTSGLGYTVIISIVESHSITRKAIKDVKHRLTRYAFSNGLMRLALHVMDQRPEQTHVILDWPDGGDARIFNMEYAAAYRKGETHDGDVSYFSGPLAGLGFSDSVLFSSMNHSTLLQFADLVLGATREFVECAIGKKQSGLGVDIAKSIRHRFRGAPKSIYGRGLSVPSGNAALRQRVKEFVAKELTA